MSEDIIFSLPRQRISGLRSVVRESNRVARQADLLTIRLKIVLEGEESVQVQVRCPDRTKMLTQELFGFIQDADDGRPFQRTRNSKRYW